MGPEDLDDEILVKAIGSLEVVLDEVVLVGGAAHRLFPLHELATGLRYDPLSTEDVDIAAPLEIAYSGSPSLRERLEQAGFEEEVAGGLYSTYRYRFEGSDDRPYVQFVVPLKGSRTRGRPLKFSGVVAEKLRYVDILLHRPWKERLEKTGTDLRVVNPVAFLVQKLLIMDGRPHDKRAKDLVYIFETLALFANSLATLSDDRELLPNLSRKQRRSAMEAAETHCFVEGDTSIGANLIIDATRTGAESSAEIVEACKHGLLPILQAQLQLPGS